MYLEAFSDRGATSAPHAPANLSEPPATPANLLPTWLALSAAVAIDAPLDDDEMNAACDAIQLIQGRILSLPATTPADLTAKLRVWRELVRDPACIIEGHPDLWAGLERDAAALLANGEVSQ